MSLIAISRALSERVAPLRFADPVCRVYNPLDYAREPHELYLGRYGGGEKEVLLIGMNPGPFGMAQTGVPFGDVTMVRDWLEIDAPVGRPPDEHPKRPVLGFDCPRAEVSGTRLWGWARDRFGTPERFFARFLVANYCPLAFIEASGRNLTPDKLPAEEQRALSSACDEALREVVRLLRPRIVIGVGGFAERRARVALVDENVTIGAILHPSPASPLANRGWAQAVERQLEELGISL
ncbi:MAG TPA: uracil-DNA glycosylase family protein [Gammaproteobacteria bacterium]|nr:uracil-DNA glycosylase family protein [Gammaproteobacteria bacterium]